jgi:predicted nuclease of predicted toxin-antitoxin system
VKILLDECIDRRLARDLSDFEIKTVPQAGWAGLKNGNLMKLAEAEFDVFITVDRNLSFQQNLPKFNIAVLVIRSKSNRLEDLQPFAPQIIKILPKLEKGEAIFIE